MKKTRNIIMTIFLVIILSISTICFAEGNETESAVVNPTDANTVVNDDLYLYGDDINMSQTVDGNAYIFGKNVTITGKIYGNLFICATGNVTFNEASYVNQSTYIVAKNVQFNANSDSLYVACNELNIPSNHGTFKDLYALTNKTTLLGSIGRNANIHANNLIMSADSAQGLVSGNLNYSSSTELQLPEGAVIGQTNYIKTNSANKFNTFLDILIGIINSIFAASLVFLLYRFFLEEGLEKSSSCLTHHFGKVFLTGLIALIAIPILSIILMAAQIGLTVGLLLLTIYIALIGISPYILASVLARRIYNNKKFSKMLIEYLIAIIIAVVIGALQMIPYIGFILSIFISILGFGIIIYNLFFNGKKHKTDEKVAKVK